MKKSVIAAALLLSTQLFASEELAQIRVQIEELKNSYDKRVEELEEKLQRVLKDKDSKESLGNNEPKAKESSLASSFSQESYIPDISLIADFSYVNRNVDESEVGHLEIPGVSHGLYSSHSHDGHSHSANNADYGFNFNYAELGLFSSVDTLLDLSAIFHITDDSFEVEEAYFTTNSLPYGLKIKGGKFLSDFGRLNSMHHHAWNFSDAPLIYRSFFGNHNLLEKGVQAQIVLPTNNYWLAGFELLQGENESSFGTVSIAPEDDEETIYAKSPDKPALFVGYIKSSLDIDDTTILAGVSYADGKSRIDHLADEEPHAFSADTKIVNAELTVKKTLDSYSYIEWQSEWMKREMDGTIFTYPAGDKSLFNRASLYKEQSGYYTQLAYALNSNYKIGVRYDNIYKNSVLRNGVDTDKPDNLDAYSLKLDYKPSEFSLFRVQYKHEDFLFNEDGEKRDMNSIIFQINLAIGAHPAHSF